jgi:hypothetical protein
MSERDEGGLHRHPQLGKRDERSPILEDEFQMLDDAEPAQVRDTARNARQLRRVTRIASLDPSDGLSL